MSFKKFFTSFDTFGEPVSLNYQGDTAFKTTIGAVFSVVIKIFFLIFSIQQLIALIEYEDPQIILVSVYKRI